MCYKQAPELLLVVMSSQCYIFPSARSSLGRIEEGSLFDNRVEREDTNYKWMTFKAKLET